MSVPRPTVIGPLAEDRRLHHIDALRGFALLGVIVGNVIWMGHDPVPATTLAALPTARLDDAVVQGWRYFVEWKFYTLFSFLFGLGFALQLTRAGDAGRRLLPTYVRRLAILFAIGVLHACLLWYGDVLHVYAALGFVLILFRRAAPRTLLVTGVLLAVVLPGIVTTKHELRRLDAPATAPAEDAKVERLGAVTSGASPYRALLAENVTRTAGFWRSRFAREFIPSVLGKFLLGFWAGRLRLFDDLTRHRRQWRRALIAGLAVGLPGTACWVATRGLPHDSASAAWANLARHPGIVGLATAYLAGLMLLLARPAWSTRLAWLTAVGRLALTNYLAHSLAMALFFYGFGLGLLGRVGAAGSLLFALTLYAGLVMFSRAWLARFRLGPAEWVWRSLTYRTLQPIRRL